ncbi:MAG: hypothetical protein AAF960_25975, partial [Bacteroidota bacterium]
VGTDLREFTFTVEEDNQPKPWFAKDIERYHKLSTMGKVIHGIKALFDLQKVSLAKLTTDERKQVLILPFESFVLDPEPWINKIESLIGKNRPKAIQKILKNQKCPRVYINAGKGHSGYGWNEADAKATEGADYERRLSFVKERASIEEQKVLAEVCREYETIHKFPRQMPWQL